MPGLLASESIFAFGATGSGSDDTLAFQRAANSGFRNIIVPPGDYLVTGQVNLVANQSWLMAGVTITQIGTTVITFNAVGIDDWSIVGPATIVGAGNASGTAAGIYVAGSNRFRVSGITTKNMSGWGFKHDPGTPSGSTRGDQGQFNSIQALNCWKGFENTAGTGAEYCTLTAPMISGCTTGLIVAAGNTSVSGGNIVDNTNGVYIGAGTNNAHGIFSGVNISHNAGYNIRTDPAMTNGQSFIGCHAYGNSSTVTDCPIYIDGTPGLSFVGGAIDCPIVCATGGGIGYNRFDSNYIPGSYTTITGTASRYVMSKGNFTPTGMWSANDKANCYVKATRTSSTQSLTAGSTTLIFNTEADDTRNAYNTTTGVFTAPWTGEYEVSAWLEITGTALAISYVTVVKQGSTSIGYFTVALSSTLLVGGGTFRVSLAAGETLELKSTITGTSPVLTTSGLSGISIRSLD